MNATCADGVSYRQGDPLFMTSLARGLRVIRALLEAGGRRTIAELSRETGLHRAVVRRCLYTLGELGYAFKEGRTYGLAPQITGQDGLAFSIGRLEEVVSRVSAQGYAMTEYAGEARARSIAVPVRNAVGVTVAAMEVVVPAAGVSRADLIDHYLPLLRTAAVVLGRGLPSLGGRRL